MRFWVRTMAASRYSNTENSIRLEVKIKCNIHRLRIFMFVPSRFLVCTKSDIAKTYLFIFKMQYI